MRSSKALVSAVSKFLESASIQIINFIVGIILARILSPDEYGIYSILLIFVTIGQTVVQAGLNSALIQQKDVDKEDYSTIYVVSLIAAGIIYTILFFSASKISAIYKIPALVTPLRAISLVLFPSALYSVVNAKIARDMEFVLAAKISIVAISVTGLVSIALAIAGAGVWALVIQQILTYTIMPITLCIAKKWFPGIRFSYTRLKKLFGFGSKILLTSLINAIYYDMQGLIIGGRYGTNTLAFYSKGQMFPRTIMSSVDTSLSSVLFPVYAELQDNEMKMKELLLKNMEMISFIVYPMLLGLFVVADQVVLLLLTDKWLACSTYIKIFCVAYLFWPIDSMNLQALKATGQSTSYLILNIIKKVIATIIIIIFVWSKCDVVIFASLSILIYILDVVINSVFLKKHIGITIADEIRHIYKNLLCSCAILLVLLIPNRVNCIVLDLIIKIFVGIGIYVLFSFTFNKNVFNNLLGRIVRIIKRGES